MGTDHRLIRVCGCRRSTDSGDTALSMWGMFGQEGDVDRSDWATKSGAAARREAKAKTIVEKALLAATSFPATVDIPCDVHLTNECWKSFSHFVKEKGGKVKRRQATIQERLASGDKRSSKMYVITVTLQKQTVSNLVAAAAAPAGGSSSSGVPALNLAVHYGAGCINDYIGASLVIGKLLKAKADVGGQDSS